MACMDSFITQHQLTPTFDKKMIINSQEVAVRKPDPKIYEVLIKRIHQNISSEIKSQQILFVDDKIENIEAAKNAGINGFVFNRKKQQPDDFVIGLASYGIKI